VLVSAVVIREVAIKRQLGKLDAPPNLLDRLEEAAVSMLLITLATPIESEPCPRTIATLRPAADRPN
jgi:PIN domain nuclease of toxin-antitoxin system